MQRDNILNRPGRELNLLAKYSIEFDRPP